VKTLPLAEAKAKLSGLIDDVARRDERVTITKRGRPAAVLMSHDEAASLDATLEIMSDPEFYAEILRNRRALDRGKGRSYSLDDLFGEEVSASSTRIAREASSRSRGRRPESAARGKEKGPRPTATASYRARAR
jgi:antitoxin YefM